MFIWCLLWEMSERHKMWLHSPGWSRTQSSPVSAFWVLGFMGMYHHTPPHVLVLKHGQNYINHVEIGRIEVSVCLKTVHSLVLGGTDLNLPLIVEVTYNRHWCLLRSYYACHVLGTFVQRGFGDRRLDSHFVSDFLSGLRTYHFFEPVSSSAQWEPMTHIIVRTHWYGTRYSVWHEEALCRCWSLIFVTIVILMAVTVNVLISLSLRSWKRKTRECEWLCRQ